MFGRRLIALLTVTFVLPVACSKSHSGDSLGDKMFPQELAAAIWTVEPAGVDGSRYHLAMALYNDGCLVSDVYAGGLPAAVYRLSPRQASQLLRHTVDLAEEWSEESPNVTLDVAHIYVLADRGFSMYTYFGDLSDRRMDSAIGVVSESLLEPVEGNSCPELHGRPDLPLLTRGVHLNAE